MSHAHRKGVERWWFSGLGGGGEDVSQSTNFELEDEYVLGPKPQLGASCRCRFGVAGSIGDENMPFFKKSVVYIIRLIYMNFPVG